MNRDLPFDPYFRPADRISTIEEKIIIAAFAAPGLLATEQARFVLGAVGEPMLIAQNQTSEVLLVAYQSNDFRNISGRFAGHRESLFPGISFFFTPNPPVQILLPKENLWVVVTQANPTFQGMVVVEITP